ncbi:MAG TPA: helix-turn-helix transcriptional regulator [Sphingomicrobium sp.]|nr:helix-turn-helix transcriptional regulator [Sphingomicrobium sp.]
MVARTPLFEAPPFEVESGIRRLGADLRTARLRRNLTLDDVAAKIGIGRRAVADAERGKPTTTIVTYVALLWAYGLVEDFGGLADPGKDAEGMALARSTDRIRARASKKLDNDF